MAPLRGQLRAALDALSAPFALAFAAPVGPAPEAPPEEPPVGADVDADDVDEPGAALAGRCVGGSSARSRLSTS